MTDKTDLVSELKNPAFYLAIASYIPTAWSLLNLPPKGASVAIGLVNLAAVLCGPIATAAYALHLAWKNSAKQGRLAQVEAVTLGLFKDAELDKPEIAAAVSRFLGIVRSASVVVTGPAGPAGEPGPQGAPGIPGVKGEKGEVSFLQPVLASVNTANTAANTTAVTVPVVPPTPVPPTPAPPTPSV